MLMTDGHTLDSLTKLIGVLMPVLEPIINLVQEDKQQKAENVDMFMSVLLQMTNTYNFSILQYYVKRPAYNPITHGFEIGKVQQTLEIAYRMFEA